MIKLGRGVPPLDESHFVLDDFDFRKDKRTPGTPRRDLKERIDRGQQAILNLLAGKEADAGALADLVEVLSLLRTRLERM